ncbi:guanine nucleotide-binding protein G(q) subunit alpha-like [Haematobia irritans]|uniref:guanine nucleotide-binding protein G(q) subunit alpha-like n=1 Tax=Haematobia irritans TaxID=7368 RepID=UPI003F4FD2BA
MEFCLYCCLTDAERQNRQVNRQINASIKKSKRHDHNRIKLLLLGTGESGKSTFLRQMRIIYDVGFSIEERKNYIKIIFENILTALQAMVGAMSYFNVDYQHQCNIKNARMIKTADLETFYRLIDIYLRPMKDLWSDAGIQECYMRRSEYQLIDAIKYYLENIDRIAAASYLPSNNDILHVRIPTTGIVEYTLKFKKVQFRMIDVGGQRSERKKWLNCFDDVRAIIFLTAISEYDQTLAERNQLNRLVESINVFKCIASYGWFSKTSLILFFNKIDLLSEKIMYSHLDKYFPTFHGPKHNHVAAQEFITKMFIDIVPGRRIYTHYTCATDTQNMRMVFDIVRDTIVYENLNTFGTL